jgi:hypothetical protein
MQRVLWNRRVPVLSTLGCWDSCIRTLPLSQSEVRLMKMFADDCNLFLGERWSLDPPVPTLLSPGCFTMRILN